LTPIKIHSEEELAELARELLYISVNLRKSTIKWNEHFGSETKVIKKKWEKRMDALIEALENDTFATLTKYAK
jgi:hypothetical protein